MSFNQANQAILIDDDELIRESWKMIFEMNGHVCHTFSCFEDFLRSENSKDTHVSIFIDVDFNGEFLGPDIADRVFKMGFHEIYLCTGYTLDTLEPKNFIKGVISKEPPTWMFQT